MTEDEARTKERFRDELAVAHEIRAARQAKDDAVQAVIDAYKGDRIRQAILDRVADLGRADQRLTAALEARAAIKQVKSRKQNEIPAREPKLDTRRHRHSRDQRRIADNP